MIFHWRTSCGKTFAQPDFIVKMMNGLTVLLEVKGFDRPNTMLKNQAAYRWVAAVNHWGALGVWDFVIVHDPQSVAARLRTLLQEQLTA